MRWASVLCSHPTCLCLLLCLLPRDTKGDISLLKRISSSFGVIHPCKNPAGDIGARATCLSHWSKIKLSGHQFSYSICTPLLLSPLGCVIKQQKTWGLGPAFFSDIRQTSHWKVTKSKATCEVAPNKVFSEAVKHPRPKSSHDLCLCSSETGPLLEIWGH